MFPNLHNNPSAANSRRISGDLHSYAPPDESFCWLNTENSNMQPGNETPAKLHRKHPSDLRLRPQNFPPFVSCEPVTSLRASGSPLHKHSNSFPGVVVPPRSLSDSRFSYQGPVEDFQSLPVEPVRGVDPEALPRPLDDDGEPSASVLEACASNCHPRFVRLTTRAIPGSRSLLSRWHLPLGMVVHPLAEAPDSEEVPVVDCGAMGVVRCRSCRTYVNSHVMFTDAGRKWRCNICTLLNDVPVDYFCSLDASGRRCDVDQRPELCKGSVEFVAPAEHTVRPPMPPTYFFLVDVSASSVRSGLLEVVAQTVRSCIDELLGFPRTRIGFLTFDSTLHFYNLKSSLTQPQMVVVSDLEDIFLPLSDDFLVNLSESRHLVDSFLDGLASMFRDSAYVESAFGPALQAAFMIMGRHGGKLLIFQSTLPSLGVGRLRLRTDELHMYGSDKEHTMRIPEDPFYKMMAIEFSKCQIAVDVFSFGDTYSDLASLGFLAKYSGGEVYHYPSFRASIHRDKLRHELARDLTRETAWEAVMRVRCGTGIQFTTYHGHFMQRSLDLLALPTVDCDKAYAIQLSLVESLISVQTAYFQVALLYTTSSGERRIRVHTLAAPVVRDLSDMYRHADTGAIVTLLSRIAVEKTLSHKLEDARQLIQLKVMRSLKEYRSLYSVQHRVGGRLIFPESLKYLPLYALSLSKSVALGGGYDDSSLDERSAAGYDLMVFSVRRMLQFLYPSLIKVDEFLTKANDDIEGSLKTLSLTARSLNTSGLYICDDGCRFIIWFGRTLPSRLANDILGEDLSACPDLAKVALCERNNETSRKLFKILTALREKDRSRYQLTNIVMQGEPPRELNSLILSKLVEEPIAGTSSYADWILQIYRQAQSS